MERKEQAPAVEIRDSLEGVDWERLEAIFQAVGWKWHTLDKIRPAFERSQHVAFAYVEGELAGCARALTDDLFYAAIYDMVVHPDFQRKGVGKAVMSHLLERLQGLCFVHLTSTRGNEAFYWKLGLRKHKTAMAMYPLGGGQEYLGETL
jgi:ribosomal protein S18 acetylase RimI-like enzyme